MKQANHNNQGFSIIELIIAISVGLFLLVPITRILDLIERVPHASAARLVAEQKAQEGIEVMELIKDDYFACVCGVDSCSAHVCTRLSDSQSCSLPDDYGSCWTAFPKNNVGISQFRISPAGAGWWLLPSPGTEDVINAQPYLGREIRIETAKRNAAGDLDDSGTPDPMSKLVTVTVRYDNHSKKDSLHYRLLLTAWKDL